MPLNSNKFSFNSLIVFEPLHFIPSLISGTFFCPEFFPSHILCLTVSFREILTVAFSPGFYELSYSWILCHDFFNYFRSVMTAWTNLIAPTVAHPLNCLRALLLLASHQLIVIVHSSRVLCSLHSSLSPFPCLLCCLKLNVPESYVYTTIPFHLVPITHALHSP